MRPVSSYGTPSGTAGIAGSRSGSGSSKVVSSSSMSGLSCAAGSFRAWNGSRDGPSRAAASWSGRYRPAAQDRTAVGARARRPSARCLARKRLVSWWAIASSVSSKVRRSAPSTRSSETSSAGTTRSWSASTDLRSNSSRWRSSLNRARATPCPYLVSASGGSFYRAVGSTCRVPACDSYPIIGPDPRAAGRGAGACRGSRRGWPGAHRWPRRCTTRIPEIAAAKPPSTSRHELPAGGCTSTWTCWMGEELRASGVPWAGGGSQVG